MDPWARGVGTAVLEAVWSPEFSLFLRLGNLFHSSGPVAGELTAFFMASYRVASIPDPLCHRFVGCSHNREARHRRYGIHVRHWRAAVSPAAKSISPDYTAAAPVGNLSPGV